MVNRQIDWEILVMALVITLVVMAGIFFAGQRLSKYKVDDLRNDIRSLETEQQSQALTLQLADSLEQKCGSLDRWTSTTVPELRELREKVSAYESSRKLDNPEYRVLKKRYMNLLIQHMLEAQKMDESCDTDTVKIIYFYSKDNCDRCNNQGRVLTHFRQKYDEKVLVYPLDSDLDVKPLNFLESYYNVTRHPTLVIEGEVYRGFIGKQEMQEIIEPELNSTGRS